MTDRLVTDPYLVAIEVRRLSGIVERQGRALEELAKREHDRAKMLAAAINAAAARISAIEGSDR